MKCRIDYDTLERLVAMAEYTRLPVCRRKLLETLRAALVAMNAATASQYRLCVLERREDIARLFSVSRSIDQFMRDAAAIWPDLTPDRVKLELELHDRFAGKTEGPGASGEERNNNKENN